MLKEEKNLKSFNSFEISFKNKLILEQGDYFRYSMSFIINKDKCKSAYFEAKLVNEDKDSIFFNSNDKSYFNDEWNILDVCFTSSAAKYKVI